MNRKFLYPFLSFLYLLLCLQLRAQSPIYRYIATDTIITKDAFAGNVYLLNGKKMNLAVMSWFMSDFPKANDQIQVARISNKLTNTGYVVGGVFFLGGALAYENNRPASNDFFTVAGVAAGSALVFQMITNFFKKEAVNSYNQDIISIYKNGQALDMPRNNGIGFYINF